MNKKQKLGLSLLILSRTFERTAFYLIMAILIQFLTTELKIETTNAGNFYSIFYGSIAFITLFSGLLGDLTNRVKVVTIGMISMTVLYFVLIFMPNTYVLMLVGFILLGISLGLNNPNISVFIGNIFNERNTQTFGLIGFIFYSIAINIGALFAPKIAFTLNDSYGFNSVFVFAAIFALISLFLYLFFSKIYKKMELFIEQKSEYETEKKYRKLNLAIFLFIIFLGILIKFILSQREFTLTFFVRDFVECGFDFNETLSNTEKYLSVILLLIFAGIVAIFNKLNWKKLFNLISIGVILCATAYLSIIFLKGTETEKNSQFPISIVFVLLIISETILYPTISYVYYRSSPIKFKGLFQGITYSIISSQLIFLGALIYEKTNPSLTFSIFSITMIISAILIFIFNKKVKGKIDKLNE